MTGPVRITHPFHPSFGLELDFVDRRPRWGEDRVFYRDRDGRRKIIAYIVERKVVKSILECLGLPTTAPPMLPAKSAWQEDGAWQDDVPTLQ